MVTKAFHLCLRFPKYNIRVLQNHLDVVINSVRKNDLKTPSEKRSKVNCIHLGKH